MPLNNFLEAVPKYQEALLTVVIALGEMTTAMACMSADHVNFQNTLNEAQKRTQDMKKEHAPKELDAEVIRSKTREWNLSAKNIIGVTAVGHYQVEKAWDEFQNQKKKLDELHNKIWELLDSRLEDRDSKKGDGHGVKAESADEVE